MRRRVKGNFMRPSLASDWSISQFRFCVEIQTFLISPGKIKTGIFLTKYTGKRDFLRKFKNFFWFFVFIKRVNIREGDLIFGTVD